MRAWLVIFGLLLAGCAEPSTPEPASPEEPAPNPPLLDAWNGSLEPILLDWTFQTVMTPFGTASWMARDGGFWCAWETQNATAQCFVEGMLLAGGNGTGDARLLDGAPPGAFDVRLVFRHANGTEALHHNTTFLEPGFYGFEPVLMEGCDGIGPTEPDPAEYTGGWLAVAQGGELDVTWTAPGYAGSATAGGGVTSELSQLQGGARAIQRADPVLNGSILNMNLRADPEIDDQVSYPPKDAFFCDNVVHDEAVPWPLVGTWTPWHGEAVDVSRDLLFQVWLESAGV